MKKLHLHIFVAVQNHFYLRKYDSTHLMGSKILTTDTRPVDASNVHRSHEKLDACLDKKRKMLEFEAYCPNIQVWLPNYNAMEKSFRTRAHASWCDILAILHAIRIVRLAPPSFPLLPPTQICFCATGPFATPTPTPTQLFFVALRFPRPAHPPQTKTIFRGTPLRVPNPLPQRPNYSAWRFVSPALSPPLFDKIFFCVGLPPPNIPPPIQTESFCCRLPLLRPFNSAETSILCRFVRFACIMPLRFLGELVTVSHLRFTAAHHSFSQSRDRLRHDRHSPVTFGHVDSFNDFLIPSATNQHMFYYTYQNLN